MLNNSLLQISEEKIVEFDDVSSGTDFHQTLSAGSGTERKKKPVSGDDAQPNKCHAYMNSAFYEYPCITGK